MVHIYVDAQRYILITRKISMNYARIVENFMLMFEKFWVLKTRKSEDTVS